MSSLTTSTSERTPTVGIVGGGQLALMTYQAALSLDVPVVVLAARADDPVARVATSVLIGDPGAAEALGALAERCDVVTFDHELVPPALLEELEAAGTVVRPSAATLRVAADKLAQRRALEAAGLPVPAFVEVTRAADLDAFGARHGWPLVLKAARGGYDGRGIWIIDAAVEAAPHLEAGLPLLVEPHLPLERELAVLVARRPGGASVAYPVVETVQVDGICHEVLAPAAVSADLAAEAQQLAIAIADLVDAVGILAVELFVVDGRLSVNELAPRPHNSGHLTIEGCATSQFENHLRAVLDLPLGATDLRAEAVAMVNVLPSGTALRPLAEALACDGSHVHLYGKQARPGRKVGHVTATGSDMDEVRARARAATRRLVAPVADDAGLGRVEVGS
ncbi:5-(carboxyamino)imidazole ribonucleotide synthase [Nitriliruptor alkaliphilus]|uniref:5-(carboxyamino)imidazole ribonucleotide synthase n=1 Tax=Nitriliruptor alkaliphilus TaxID=427918 RepID=UPI0009F9A8FA|nr:5-(carboxyamino)imidazole ribonucleotide synthase [Nitriliruptor alkaliphilus]